MKFHIPIRLPSLANSRLHWTKMKSVKKDQKLATYLCIKNALNRGARFPHPPLLVTITRVGPKKMDDDNVAAACKYVRDEIADAIGLDDGSDQYTWVYKQEIGEYGVDVEITSRGTGPPLPLEE